MAARRRVERSISTTLAAASAAFVAVLAYYEVLSYWFTGTDTIPLIETSRVSTLGGVVEIFAGPLMEGSHFTDRALFYRPVASLSYAVDYWLWGLDPFGYHLTDLLAHATAAALVVWLVYEILGDRLTAALAGWIFALHPLSVEVVPTPARRHDVLATVFALGALCLFVRALKTTIGTDTDADEGKQTGASRVVTRGSATSRRRWLLLAGSLLSYLLAVGSKEIGILVPALVGTWFLVSVYGRRLPLRRALRGGVALLGPYAVATAAYLGLRLVVLGGLGGYDRPAGSTSGEPIAVTVSRYVLSLVYPVDFVGALSGLELQLIPNGLYVVLAGTSVLVVHDFSRTRKNRSVLADPRGRLFALAGVWFAVPVWLFVRTGRYTLRSGYVSIVPVAAVLAVLVVTAARNARARRRDANDDGGDHERAHVDGRTGEPGPKSRSKPGSGSNSGVRSGSNPGPGPGPRSGLRSRSGPGLATLAVVCVLVASLVAGSALVNPYGEWERAGEVSEDTLEAISEGVAETPANATVDVAPIPHPRSARRMSSFPHAQSVTFVWGNTIESWLRLRGQAGERDVYINDTVVLSEMPETTTATTERQDGRVNLTIHYDRRSEPSSEDDGEATNGTVGPDASVTSSVATARVGVEDRKSVKRITTAARARAGTPLEPLGR